jgi:hypothetical protein
MAKTARKVVVVMGMVALALAGTKLAAFGAEPEFPAMRILVITVAGVLPPDMLARAQAETARIYAAVGVRLTWEARTAPTTAIGPADTLSSLTRLTMLIISNPNAWPERVAADALGAAPAADRNERGPNAVGRNRRLLGRCHGPAEAGHYVLTRSG